MKCNLREFNEYRKWVRKLKLDAYHREQRDEREKWERQRRERDVERHLLRDRDLYQITKVREHKAKEMMEKRRKKREADKRKFMKLEEEDMKRREKFEDERRRRKDLVEAKREKQLERKCRVKQKQDEKVKFFPVKDKRLNSVSPKCMMFSQTLKTQCIREVVRIGSINHLSSE